MFNATASIQHSTPIPSGISIARAVALLHDHETFIKFDPHMVKFALIATPPDATPTMPEGRHIVATAAPKCYTITDRVHALPAGLWDSDVVSTYEFINFDRGVFVRIRSPLSVLLETVWEIKDTAPGACELFEDILIKCSRLLVGPVRNQCEGGWKAIHDQMIAKLKEQPAAEDH